MFLIWCANIEARIFIEKNVLCMIFIGPHKEGQGDERKMYCQLLVRLQHHMKQGQKVKVKINIKVTFCHLQ